ncbi:hypothetical protein [Flaviaesturariibacter amylovorans]|uniref:Uncharacterized protein n=1 Tax=Flaviaesturariibacter amylovorans TaxID=1084520 RepID=A0ABP8HTZ9_9BACT
MTIKNTNLLWAGGMALAAAAAWYFIRDKKHPPEPSGTTPGSAPVATIPATLSPGGAKEASTPPASTGLSAGDAERKERLENAALTILSHWERQNREDVLVQFKALVAGGHMPLQDVQVLHDHLQNLLIVQSNSGVGEVTLLSAQQDSTTKAVNEMLLKYKLRKLSLNDLKNNPHLTTGPVIALATAVPSSGVPTVNEIRRRAEFAANIRN